MSDSSRGRNYTLGFLAGAILAGIVGFSFWSDATESEEQIRLQAQEHAEQYADAARVSVECEAPDITAPAQGNCITAEQEAANDAERSEYDLEAQKIMANWTRVMGKAAIVGMGVGILGLFLIFVTFWETRKAADAGREANIIAREQQRARIVASAKSVQISAHQEALVLSCENIGASPALRLRCSQGVFDNPPTDPTVVTDRGEYRTVKAGSESQLCVVGMEALAKFIAGIIEYDTISQKGCRTYFCFRFAKSNISDDYFAIECVPSQWPEDI
jgi:hypothetical protein